MSSHGTELIKVEVAWEALEDAFENNAHEVHSYLHLGTGEVTRLVDGVADPALYPRIAADNQYRRVDPVSSREQYRWMERFIETVQDEMLKARLNAAIDGKGAFRRFKDALMNFQPERERWFVFRSERLGVCIEAWLKTHGLLAVRRPKWEVPFSDAEDGDHGGATSAGECQRMPVERRRSLAMDLVNRLPSSGLDTAIEFLEYIVDRHGRLPAFSKEQTQVRERKATAEDVTAIPVSVGVKQ